MSSKIGGKSDKIEKRRRRQWLYRFSLQKASSSDYLFPSRGPEDKNHHYILKFDLDRLEKQIIDPDKAKPNKRGEHFDVQLNFSFYHRKQFKFYGRTYTSSLIRGKCERGLFSARNIKEDVYFQSKFVNEDVFLIIDVLIVRKRQDRDDVFYSGGYYISYLFEDNKPNTNCFYVEETPRNLLIKGYIDKLLQASRISASAKLVIEELKKKRDIEIYDQVAKYIPPHTLVGKNDEIPGVRNILDARADYGYAFLRDTIFLHNLHIKVKRGWEAKLIEDISFPLSQKYSFLVQNRKDVLKIFDRRLIIQVHNSWNVIDQQMVTLKYNKESSELEASSIIKLENVFVDPNIAIIFILEYQIKVKVGKARGDYVNTRIGYSIVIPETGKAEFKKSSFITAFQTGPKPSLDGVTQWTPTNIYYEDGKEAEPIDFDIRGIMAPTETLRKLKTDIEEPKIIKVENKEDKEEIKKLKKLEKENQEKFLEEKEKIKREEKRKREETEEEVMSLKKKIMELEEAKKLATIGKEDDQLKAIDDKNKLIEELEKQLKETKKLQRDKSKSGSRSPSPDKSAKKKKKKSKERKGSVTPEKSKERHSSEEEKITSSPAAKQKIIKTGMDADEVMQLIRTVMESTNAGIPLDTRTLGKTGAVTQRIPEEFIKDLQEIQRDKVSFVGSKGGSAVLKSSALTRRDKIHLMKLGLGKGLLDSDLEEFIASEPSLEKELADPNTACKVAFKFVVLKTGDSEGDIARIPTRLFMTFKFFTFPESNTTDCRLFEDTSEAEIRKPEINKSYGLVRENYDENKVDIEEKKA